MLKKTLLFVAGGLTLTAAAFGTKALIAAKREAVRQQGLVDYLDQNKFSLQNVGGKWAVTNAEGNLAGATADTPAEAIDNAIWQQLSTKEKA